MFKNTNSNKITAIAITFNEQENVKRFVDSMSFVDEIIFIDCFSTDKTATIARELGVCVIEKELINFSESKNFGISKAKNNWILFLNLNEIISPQLETEVLAIDLKSIKNVAFSVNRFFLFMGKQIKHGNLQNNKIKCFFNKNFCSYNENLFNGELIVNGATSILKNSLDNYIYKEFDYYNDNLNYYSSLHAKFLYYKKSKPTLYHLILKPFFQLYKNYVIKLGFLDKKEGFILAYVHSFSTFKTYLQLWMMYRKIE